MPDCRIIFRNKTPDWWQATIIGIGATFFYKRRDGSIIREYATSKSVSLKAGQSDELHSDDPSMCVGAMVSAFLVSMPGEPNQTKTKSDGTNPNECATEWDLCIEPSGGGGVPTIEEALNTRNVEARLVPSAYRSEKL